MIRKFCDFCGEEMNHRDKCATLTIHGSEPTGDPLSLNAFTMAMLSGMHRSTGDSKSMEMCAACLGHLLPVTQRIRAERAASKAKKGPRNGVIETELRPSFGVVTVGGA
jgi:hypothetical protein